MRSAVRFALVSTLALSFAAGCGGGDVSGVPHIPTLPFDTSIVGGQTGTTTTPAQRIAALDVVRALVTALPRQNFAAETQTLVGLLRSMPVFANAGSSADGTVWAQFKGGTMLLIVNGPGDGGGASPELPPRAAVVARASMEMGRPSFTRAPSAQSLDGTVPNSETFRLFDAIGTAYPGSEALPEIASMLTANGYRGRTESATLSALRTVQGDGIFYIRAHGGMGSVNEDSATRDVYALWSATPASAIDEENDRVLALDLLAVRVVYMVFRVGRFAQAFPSVFANTHYGITDQFVAHYMSLSPNSLVYIDACEGANQPSLRSAFRNASVFVGWNERALFGNIATTSRYVFDRLLGANTYEPESPKQRPFPYASLALDPRFGHGKRFGYSSAPGIGGTIEADLGFYRVGGEFGLLAPSLFAVRVDEEKDELHLYGNFGSDPGSGGKITITENGSETSLAVTNWTSQLIRAALPKAASGNVVVSVRGHKSNARQLVLWEGMMNFTSNDVGTLTQRFELDFRARVDPQDVRDAPGQPPKPTPMSVFYPTKTSQARYAMTGTYSMSLPGGCTSTEDWTGSGTISATLIPASNAPMYTYAGETDLGRNVLGVLPIASSPTALGKRVTVRCPTGATTLNHTIGASVDIAVLDAVKRRAELQFDGSLNVVSGGLQKSVQSTIDASGNKTLSLQWSGISARPAVDRTLPR